MPNAITLPTRLCQVDKAAEKDEDLYEPFAGLQIASYPFFARLPITKKEARPLVRGRSTFFSLPGELRNHIYHLALDKAYQRVPLNVAYNGRADPFVTLMQTCSAVYHEARSYMVEQQTAYIPVMAGMDWTYGEPAPDYGLSRATKDTTVSALTDFMDVHFHLHIDLLHKDEYDPYALLTSLAQAIKVYTPRSFELYLAHGLGKRRAMIHLDHLLSLWPKLFDSRNCISFWSLPGFLDLIAEDKMTEWDVRYYVATGQAGESIAYGHCKNPADIRDTELVQLRYYTHRYSNIKIMAEIYGDHTTWEYGDAVRSVTRHRTPVSEFWPNVHFDGSRWYFTTYDDFEMNYPNSMPLEYFDEEVLVAAQDRRYLREC